MYYPYFRGKQYELIAIRENAEMLSASEFVPIIEPVKESLSGLKRAIEAVDSASGNAVLVVNPIHGDHAGDPAALDQLVREELEAHESLIVGVAATPHTELHHLEGIIRAHLNRPMMIIHAGFSEGRALSDLLGELDSEFGHVFFEDSSGKLYQRHFRSPQRVLLRDGFKARVNREHPPAEFFSDLHATYEEEGMSGFGDFLIVGDTYSETGGPAYAVAIHLTFIDPARDDEMHIFHFVSDRQDTPTDPAGKFSESLDKLVAETERPGSPLLRTEAVNEFIELHRRRHYPGLGYVKKLSMQHHMETMANYFQTR